MPAPGAERLTTRGFRPSSCRAVVCARGALVTRSPVGRSGAARTWTESLTRRHGSITLEWWTDPTRRVGHRTSWFWPRRAETARRSGGSTSGSGRWCTACCSHGCRTARWTTSCRTSSSRRSSGCPRCVRRARSVRGWRRSPATAPSIITAVRRSSRSRTTSPRPTKRPQAEARAVLSVIQLLPAAYRETLVLRLVEGMTGQEIADRTGLTPASVRVNLHRGMKRLREALRLKRGAPYERQVPVGSDRRARPGRRTAGTPAWRRSATVPARSTTRACRHPFHPPDRAGDGGGSSWRPPPAPRW